MRPLHCQATASIILLVIPAVTGLVPTLPFIRQTQRAGINENARKMGGSARLSLGIDPTDVVAQHSHLMDLHHHVAATAAAAASRADAPSSALDALSTFTLAKASLVPNQSVAPLAETIKGAMDGSGPNNIVEQIPDMPAMPGGAPRTGNPFLAESFRDLYDGAIMKHAPQAPPDVLYGPDGSLVVPARELDVVGRYADVLSRIPLAAAVYACVDFFLINAEEDMAIADFLDDEEEVRAMMEVENRVVTQRLLGLFVVVVATILWSVVSYHPVPFGEL